jgi:hypothetical protein
VGYASSRAHNNETSRSGLGFHHELKHGLKCCTCRSCFHNSNGVLKGLAQAARIEDGLCEFARAQQQDQSLEFGFSSQIETWLTVLHLSLVFS